jgi:hypothetical protein
MRFRTAVGAVGLLLCVAGAAILALRATSAAFTATSPTGSPVYSTDGGRYEGALKDGKFHGKGRLVWPHGAVYEGEFAEGLYSGQGRLQFASGDFYEGDFVQGEMDGKGRHVSGAGTEYVGEFKDGLYHGQGRFDDGHATTYEGTFARGVFHGQGKLISRGDEYTGEFRHSSLNGHGEVRYRDGRLYQGDFQNSDYHGKGRFTGSNGEVYDGDFKTGVFTGNGVFTAPGGYRYEGAFENWRPHGPGRTTDPSGTVFEGTFSGGELIGEGKISWKDGARYEGEIRRWMPNGKGVMRRANGDVYRGQFKFGEYDGEGTLTLAVAHEGKTSESGVWRYGRLKDKEERERRDARSKAEAALYVQPALLAKTLETVQPSDPKRINLYLLAIAGDGSQEVFRREVDFVREQFDTQFGTRGRSIALVNSRTTVEKYPMATVSSIRRSVQAIAEKMNRETDILFLFITSHGSKEHELSLGLRGVDLPPLSATDLAAILKESGIRWKVVVASACYAGGFIEPLKDGGTLTLTAARHDRRSFGCSDDNDFTYFGRAYFKEALPKSTSFQAAFVQAERLINEWELRDFKAGRATDQAAGADTDEARTEAQADKLDVHSLPQISESPPIAQQLERWWKQQLAERPRRR